MFVLQFPFKISLPLGTSDYSEHELGRQFSLFLKLIWRRKKLLYVSSTTFSVLAFTAVSVCILQLVPMALASTIHLHVCMCSLNVTIPVRNSFYTNNPNPCSINFIFLKLTMTLPLFSNARCLESFLHVAFCRRKMKSGQKRLPVWFKKSLDYNRRRLPI